MAEIEECITRRRALPQDQQADDALAVMLRAADNGQGWVYFPGYMPTKFSKQKDAPHIANIARHLFHIGVFIFQAVNSSGDAGFRIGNVIRWPPPHKFRGL